MGFNQRFLKQHNAMSSQGLGKEEVLIAVFLPYLRSHSLLSSLPP
jgi:hypothetical protein